MFVVGYTMVWRLDLVPIYLYIYIYIYICIYIYVIIKEF